MLSPKLMSQKEGMKGIEPIALKSANGAIFFVWSKALWVRIGNSLNGVVDRCLSQGQKYAQPPPQGYESGVYAGLATKALRLA